MSVEFWNRIKQRCELGIELDEGQFDLHENLRDRSCLGTAFTAEQRAYSLVLVGMDNAARFYLENIREHALRAFDADETYVFQLIKGRNLFGRYMAHRIAGLADWALGGSRHQTLFKSALGSLQDAIEAEYGHQVLDAEPIEVGALCVLQAHVSDWEGVLSVCEQWQLASKQRMQSIWVRLLESLVEIAQNETQHHSNEDPNSFLLNSLFRDITDHESYDELHHPQMRISDVVSISRIRGESLYGVWDPWHNIRSIRKP